MAMLRLRIKTAKALYAGSTKSILVTTLAIAIFGQSICIPLQRHQIPIILFVGISAVLLLSFKGVVKVEPTRYILATLLFSAAILSLIINYNDGYTSIKSLFYLIIIYTPLILVGNISKNSCMAIIKAFQTFLFVISIFAIMQLISQLVINNFVDIRSLLPSYFLIKHYNTTYKPPVFNFYKSNGFFLLEPSFLSQYVAMAIIFESIFFQRMKYIFIYSAALLLSFSGTGIIMIIACVPLIWRKLTRFIIKKKNYSVPVIIALSVLIVYLAPAFIMRIEAQSHIGDNSFTVRWIYPFIALRYLTGMHFILGYGPGSETRYSFPFFPNFTAILSVFFQYGLLGLILYIWFIFKLIRDSLNLGFGIAYSAAVFIPYLFLSGALLQPFSISLLFALSTFLKPSSAREVDIVTQQADFLQNPMRKENSELAYPYRK